MADSTKSLPELTREAASHFGDLIRAEIRLARAETMEKVQGLGGGAARIAIGVLFASAALTVALLGAAYALSNMMPMWGAALLVAAVAAVVAYAMIASGRKAMAQGNLALPRTASQIATDVNLIKDKVTP